MAYISKADPDQMGYSVHPSEAYARSVAENLPIKTGLSLEE